MALFRYILEEKIGKAAKAIYDGGVRLFEITFNPSDNDTIKKTRTVFEIVKNLLAMIRF